MVLAIALSVGILLLALTVKSGAHSFLEDSRHFKIVVVGFLITYVVAAVIIKLVLPPLV